MTSCPPPLISLFASPKVSYLLSSALLSSATDFPCSGMLGMVSGLISDAQISASSYADRGWVAENARLLTGRSGWTGQQTRQPFKNEWLQVSDERVSGRFCLLNFFLTFLRGFEFFRTEIKHERFPIQVDMGQEKMVTGVVIQGGKHRDRNVYMKKFKVGHSLDGEDWTIIKEDNSSKPKVGRV